MPEYVALTTEPGQWRFWQRHGRRGGHGGRIAPRRPPRPTPRRLRRSRPEGHSRPVRLASPRLPSRLPARARLRTRVLTSMTAAPGCHGSLAAAARPGRQPRRRPAWSRAQERRCCPGSSRLRRLGRQRAVQARRGGRQCEAEAVSRKDYEVQVVVQALDCVPGRAVPAARGPAGRVHCALRAGRDDPRTAAAGDCP
jgi:hypothetical protein